MRTLTALLLLIVSYSTAQTWRGAGLGTNFNVEVFLTDSNDKLYVGGSFTNVDGVPRTAIAIWDSVQWSDFGNNAVFKGTISCMTFYNGELIVGGAFDSINNISIKNVAKWNGTNWQPVGDGFNNTVYTLQVYHDQLYAGGNFYLSGSDTIGHLAKWNGTIWEKAVTNIDGYVYSSTIYRDMLILGGEFTRLNGANIYNVAALNDTVWTDLNLILNNQVYKVKTIDDTLFVTGNFTQITGYPFNFICRYDGSTWSQVPYPIGTTLNVADVEKYNSKIYLCGNFDNPDDLCLINGINCDSVGSSNGFYVCMTTYKHELYVGGNFTNIGPQSANCLAIYDDGFWSVIDEIPNRVFNVYPNPYSKQSSENLSVTLLDESSIALLSIFSIEGKMLQSSADNNLHLEKLPEGVYIIVLTTKDDKTFTHKLILTL